MEDASNVDLSCTSAAGAHPGRDAGVTVKDDYNPETEQYTLTIRPAHAANRRAGRKTSAAHPVSALSLCDSGRQIDPAAEGRSSGPPRTGTLTRAEQTFIFDNVYFQPVPALLCEFSRPVKLEYKWAIRQLTFLMRHACNVSPAGMPRRVCWRAFIAEREPLSAGPAADAAGCIQQTRSRAILLDESIDPALAAEILVPLPVQLKLPAV